MTTFQAIIYAMIHGISQFLPLSPSAHETLIPYLIGWDPPPATLLGAMTVGAFLAILMYFRHEWASMISCFLQVILYRKRPMTLDERLPLFIGISLIPTTLAASYLTSWFDEQHHTPFFVTLVFVISGLFLWCTDSLGRKTKGIYDWNSLDAIIVGLIQAAAILPGFDSFTAILIGGLFLNYRREAVTKFAYFTLTPILFVKSISFLQSLNFSLATPPINLSWLSCGIAILVTFLIGLLCMGGFMKHVQQKGLAQYALYRWALALGVLFTYWIRT